MKKALPVLLCLYACFLQGQTTKFPVTGIPVERFGRSLQNAWAGGINAPQFFQVDLNNDGLNDLFVFDRGSNKVLTFLNDGSHSDTAFHYAPEYEAVFPVMTQWAALADYNRDGIPDLFTFQMGETDNHGNAVPVGIKVYKGSRVAGNLHYDVVKYCLYYFDAPYTVNILPNGLGQPAIVDVNGDGDLDILTVGVYGTAVEYYENQTVEQGLSPDSMIFSQVTSCWGNFYVGNSFLQVDLNVSCKGGTGQGTGPQGPRHTGAALSAFDNQNDHDIDLLLSGAHVDYLALLNNTGSSSYANIGWVDTLWPHCDIPAHMPYFPAVYQVDADNDGFKDMLVAPIFNAPAMDVNNVLLYHYVTGDTCSYQYSGNDSFLVSSMIDFGTDSKAVFFDFNGDGLMDIVAGNYYYYNATVLGTSQLGLYQNVGTNTQPRYQLVTTDYCNLSQYSLASGTMGYNPAFGDLDGDGKPDMLVGDANGYLSFFKNVGGPVASFPSMTIADYDSINVGGNAAPFIYDVNGDSLPDLIIGRVDGGLSYYWNYGTKTAPMFNADSVNNNFGGINVTSTTSTIGNSQPYIMRDSLGNMELFVGSDQGLIFEYAIDISKLRSGNFALLDSNFLRYNAGARVTIQAYDLNGDGKLEYLVGNALGGLQMFSETLWDSSNVLAVQTITPESEFAVYPNPANQQFTCLKKEGDWKNAQIALYNLLGQRILTAFSIQSNQLTFSTSELGTGVYVLRIESGERIYNAKILVQH